MQTKFLIPFVVLVAIIFVAGVWWFGQPKSTVVSERESAESPAVSGEQVPNFSLTDYEGKTVNTADFSGKPLVVNSWAVWCPFCVKELADFATVQKEFGDRVVIIAIDRAESRDVAKEFTDKLGLGNNLVLLLDPSDSFYQAIGGFSMPETLFMKADGTIHFHKRGPMAVEEMRQRVSELVQ